MLVCFRHAEQRVRNAHLPCPDKPGCGVFIFGNTEEQAAAQLAAHRHREHRQPAMAAKP